MALVQVRVFDCRIVITGEEPGPAETYVEGGAIDCSAEYGSDVEALKQAEASIEAATEFQIEAEAINPDGGEIRADIEAAATIAADVEGITL